MDRYYFENPGALTPDEETEEEQLIAETGNQHEHTVLEEFKASEPNLVDIPRVSFEDSMANTLSAIKSKAPIIFQAAFAAGRFAGYADFLILDKSGRYQVWDSKLALSPKPYYAIQLCCYTEMLAAETGELLPEKFGLILGSKKKVEFRVEDFIHYYRHIKAAFLAMEDGFTGNITDRPEPLPGVDHGRWTSIAEQFFIDTDHLVRVAGITVGQIKKLKNSGICEC